MPSSVSVAVPLVVQLLTPVSVEEQDVLLQACSLAHQAGPCIQLSEATEADTLRASVDLSGGTRVTLDVTDTDPNRSLYVSRELFFDLQDDKAERARAIGIALGVLATTLTDGRHEPQSDASDAEPSPPDENPNDESPVDEPTAANSDTSPLRPWGLGLAAGLTLDPRWSDGAPSGALSLMGYPHDNWGALLRGQGTWFPSDSRNVPLRQLSVSLGPSFRSTPAPVYLTSTLTFGLVHTEAHLTQTDAETRKGSHLSALIHAEVGLGWQMNRTVCATLVPAVDWVPSSTRIVVDGYEIGSTGRLQASILAGVGFFFPSPQGDRTPRQGSGTQ